MNTAPAKLPAVFCDPARDAHGKPVAPWTMRLEIEGREVARAVARDQEDGTQVLNDFREILVHHQTRLDALRRG